jgi:GWxTD domain-containing protein
VGTSEPAGPPPERVTRLFDPTTAFRDMGLIAETGPLPLVGSVRTLAGPAPDTSLVLVALSLQSRGLTFRREQDAFLAEYRVELVLRQGTSVARQLVRDESIRVVSFRETQRSDESVIFQQFVPAAPGQYVMALTLRDRNGPNSVRFEQVLVVPRYRAPSLIQPVAVYQAAPRSALNQPPELVANPRGAVDYGGDSVRFYLETYGLPAGAMLRVSAVDGGDKDVWRDSARLDAEGPVRSLVMAVPQQRLSLGRFDLRVSASGLDTAVGAPFLITFSDRWVVTNLDEVASLLRYFAASDSLRSLLQTPPEQRGEAWQRFWRNTDPNPATPENEALDEYFARLQQANDQFRDEGVPGWLTDRGEVFVSLGEPDDVIDRRSDAQGRGRVIYWVYNEHRLTLGFVDDTGFGRFRLDPRSRSEFIRVLNRIRRGQ